MENFNVFGIMLDCSRNAVMRPEQVKKFIDYIAKMGYNALELYTEDTYVLPNEKYFGYLRGGYTGAEIKDIDEYAISKGVELIPCIQTLAHFTNTLKLPQFNAVKDVNDILLVGEPKTYELIEKFFEFLSNNFSSRKVNIGMDEAHLLGLGKYLDENGYQNRFEIFLKHLNKVNEIAKKYGFIPHMWSDMFFRLKNKGEYYGKNLLIEKEIMESVPENVGLAYWDYYNFDKKVYDGMFRSHKAFNREVWFAGGAWCWAGFAPFNSRAMHLSKIAIKSAIKNGIKNAIITMWGDNGKECSFFSVLPALYAIRQYALGNYNEKEIKKGFYELFGFKFDDFTLLDKLNATKANVEDFRNNNPCKALLYNDCFLGLFDKALEKEGNLPYFAVSKKLKKAAGRVGEFGYIHETLFKLSKVLELKADLGIRTRKAYVNRDEKELNALVKVYTEVEKILKNFYDSFRLLWMKENKPFGFEIQDARLGGLIMRVSSCKQTLKDYLDGKIDKIEELETELLEYSDSISCNNYAMLISTSGI